MSAPTPRTYLKFILSRHIAIPTIHPIASIFEARIVIENTYGFTTTALNNGLSS